MKNVRETILKSSKKLFLEKGYEKTTIREIISSSGILSGSIYHFFKNKEDILNSLVLEIFDDCEQMILNYFGHIDKPEFLYILMTAIQLKSIEKNERIRELYYEAYSSDLIFERIVDQDSKKLREVFRIYNPEYDLSDYYNANLMIKGSIRSCIVDCRFDNKNSNDKRNDILFNMILNLMNVSKDKSKDIINSISMMNTEIEYIVDELIEYKLSV